MHTNIFKKISRLSFFIITGSGLFTPSLLMAENFEPEGIRTGSVVFYPFAGITFGHDDNVLSQETDAVESGITTITAGLGMQVSSDNSRNNIEANLQVEDGKYDSSPDDDYQDGNFNLGYNYQPHDKLSLLTEIGVSKQHEPRAYDTVATRTSPDEYTDTTFDFDWNYGSKGVDGSDTSIAVNVTDRDYDTNLDLTEAYNRSTSMVSWYLHYPVAANTRMRLSARALNFDYDTTHSRSGNQARIMVGADWQASDFTLLSIEVGQQNKDFDEDTIEDESDSAWEVGFSWAPEEYSTFQVSSSKDFDESTSAANYLRNTSLDMTWIYGWNDNLKTTLGFGSGEETSVYATTDATDATKYASLSFQYAISPVAQFVGGYQATSVDSDSDGGSSDKSVINLGFKAAF